MNLFNLNNHIEIPIFPKPTRDLTFTARFVWDLSDSLTATQVPSGGDYWHINTSYIPLQTSTAGYNSHVSAGSQTCSPAYPGQAITISFDSIIDENHTIHLFKNGPVQTTVGLQCNAGTASDPTNDGWLLTFTTTNQNCQGYSCITAVTETDPAGNIYSSGNAIVTNPNGNKILGSGIANGATFTDSTGNTVFTTQNPFPQVRYTYSYPLQSGGTTSVRVNYTSGFTPQNNFGCNIAYEDTGGSTIAMPTSIGLPDGSQYSLVYESANGTYPSTAVTGRIHSITVPAGGTYTYTYSGSNPTFPGTNGVNCGDGKPMILTITGSDGSVWTYNRSMSSCVVNCTGPWSTTVVTDPACNDTIYNFDANGDQMQAQNYQGTAGTANCSPTTKTLLQTIVSC